MDRKDFTELFKDNRKAKREISAAAITNIYKFAVVSLRMDNDTLDYFYEVYIDDLLESEIPDEELTVMKEQGWFISKDKKNLRIYI